MNDRPRFSGGRCIPDVDTLDFLSRVLDQVNIHTYFKDIHLDFCAKYRAWVESTELNIVSGLDQFPYQQFTQGTTEAIDKFYMRHRDKTIKVLSGEYPYHTKAGYAQRIDTLTSKDALIISLPFASTGSQHRYKELLQEATNLNIPVFVDCAWFGTCYDLRFDFYYPCIEEISFSLSKTFPLAHLRVGCRFTKVKDGLTLYSDAGYLNWLSQWVGIQFLDHFSPDYIPQKYYKAQQSFCKNLNVTPSNCIQIATGNKEWEHLDRDGFNRLCLSDEILEWYYEET